MQIDIAPDMLSLRYPMEVNLVGDSAQTLRALLPVLDRKTERSWRGHREKNVAEWWRVVRGDPQEGSVIVGAAKGPLGSLLPGRGK